MLEFLCHTHKNSQHTHIDFLRFFIFFEEYNRNEVKNIWFTFI